MLKPSLSKCKRVLIFVIISMAITACSMDIQTSGNNSPRLTTATPYEIVTIQESAVVYTTLKEIVDRSDVIVVGRASNKKGIVNIARDPSNHTIPDPIYFSIGQIYEVQIDSYLKGEGKSNIFVIQNEGFFSLASQQPTSEIIEQAKNHSDSIPLIIGKRYIMFLSSHDPEYSYADFPIDEFLFAKGHPWQFEITDTDCVQPVDKITDLYMNFPAQTLDKFIQFINNPTTFPEVPYPAPLSSERCTEESIVTTPYP
jgi:hypothetical protein